MSILLTKHHDITEFASKDAKLYTLQSVHYHADKKLVEACDGNVLIRVPVTESEEFPPVKGELNAAPVDCLIPLDAFKKALGNIPRACSLPILSYSKLDSNGKVTLTATDLDTEQSVTCKPIDGQYPNCDQVIPDKPGTLKVAIAGGILKRISEYALKHSRDKDCTVNFEFIDTTSPIRFSINIKDVNGNVQATGVAMPMKLT